MSFVNSSWHMEGLNEVSNEWSGDVGLLKFQAYSLLVFLPHRNSSVFSDSLSDIFVFWNRKRTAAQSSLDFWFYHNGNCVQTGRSAAWQNWSAKKTTAQEAVAGPSPRRSFWVTPASAGNRSMIPAEFWCKTHSSTQKRVSWHLPVGKQNSTHKYFQEKMNWKASQVKNWTLKKGDLDGLITWGLG